MPCAPCPPRFPPGDQSPAPGDPQPSPQGSGTGRRKTPARVYRNPLEAHETLEDRQGGSRRRGWLVVCLTVVLLGAGDAAAAAPTKFTVTAIVQLSPSVHFWG
jgi:hypothetical protein